MQLPKVYEPSAYEADIYALWEQSGVFTADPTSKKPRYSISMPPPNETGTLSLGHALFLTLQDIAVRYKRLRGHDVLWLPGTDHAALAVNAIIEKKLAEEGTNKHAVGREEFLRRTKEFVAGSRDTMLGQMRAMGASADWSRLRYTLDPSLSRAVNETFVKMYNDGLIYRGHRIVNWDPNLETTVSDDEIEYQSEKTTFYTLQYGPFQIGTARPETKFGDKYVVMHPDDKRYAKYKHGDTFEAEWINGTVTATIIKDEAIDPSFGTGVMTITPWHDHTDFDIAERHGLDKEQIIDFKGNLLPIAGDFAGQPIHEARPQIIAKLREKGLLVSEDVNYEHNIAVNERGKGIIEPQIKLQWFVDVNKQVVPWNGKTMSLKQVLQSVVREGDITIIPNRFEKTYFNWIDHLHDWCISRQIWWGHRIPVWYRQHADGQEDVYAGLQAPEDDGAEGWNQWEQDPDTLDTWFSSSLWTWSTLLDPKLAEDTSLSLEDLLRKSPDFKAYHPTSLLETGWDIIFFWVARMILSTTYVTGQVPFKTVYLHGMVRAADGKKMSKSRPESIVDPLDVISKHGTDALRMGIIMGVSPGNDQNWSWERIESNRNFCNKLWNIARFIEDKVGDDFTKKGKPEPQTAADHWMLSKLQHSIKYIPELLDDYRFGDAYDHLYHLVWDDLADWYIEASKADTNPGILAYSLETILVLLHPFAPFVTETIWQTLKWENSNVLAAASWPKPIKTNPAQVKAFDEVQRIISEIRFVQGVLRIRSGLTLYHKNVEALEIHGKTITRLARLEAIRTVQDGYGLHLTDTSYDCWLDLDQESMHAFMLQLKLRRDEQAQIVKRLESRLRNKSYVQNAPKAVVDETRKQLEEAKATLVKITNQHERFANR